jgi:hypothetical protein
MRRAVVLSFAILALSSSCRGGTEGPAEPTAGADVQAVASLDDVAARGTAISFVRAYADAPTQGVDRLAGLVADAPWMTRWVHWYGVQLREFPGEQHATSSIASVSGSTLVPVEGEENLLRQVTMDGEIVFDMRPADRDPFTVTRVFQQLNLYHAGQGDWRVVDAVRDGISIGQSFQVPDPAPAARADDGARVVLDSYLLAPALQFDLIVEAPRSTGFQGADLIDEQGGVVATATSATASLRTIGAGSTVEGIVVFDARQDLQGLSLRVNLGGSTVSIPLPPPGSA